MEENLLGIITNNSCQSERFRLHLSQRRRKAPYLPSTTPPQTAHKEFTMEDKVLNAMKEAGKPVRPGDIAKALGVDSKEVSKACAELKKAGKIYSPKRCYYEPVAE